MNNRAQTIGQVFIFIVAGLVFVLILGYGYKAIASFIEKGEDVQLIDFQNELDSAITVIKRDYGSVQRVDLRLPTKAEQVCFVTSNPDDAKDPTFAVFKQDQPMLYSAWETSGENVFLLPRVQKAGISISDLLVDPSGKGYVCINVVGARISLRVEGTGNKAIISEWPAMV